MKLPTDFLDDNDDEGYDLLVNCNDELFDASVDEFKNKRNKEGVRVMNSVDDDGFQLVKGRKKKGVEKDLLVNNNNTSSNGVNSSGSSPSVKVACRDSNATGAAKAKVPFHIASIRRPQDEYKILVNNCNQPFEHVWLQSSEDGSRFIHPLVSCYHIMYDHDSYCLIFGILILQKKYSG